MSHYHLGLILPRNQDWSRLCETIERMLAPYDERVAVAPHKKYLEESLLAGMRESFVIAPDAPLSAYLPYLQGWIGDDGKLDEKGLYYMTTENPLARWDGYEIGGRWCGCLRMPPDGGCPGGSHDPGRIERKHLELNCVPVRELTPEAVGLLFALCTPNGQSSDWWQRGRMGWFGHVHDPMPESGVSGWPALRAEVLSSHPGDFVLSLDCHI